MTCSSESLVPPAFVIGAMAFKRCCSLKEVATVVPHLLVETAAFAYRHPILVHGWSILCRTCTRHHEFEAHLSFIGQCFTFHAESR